MAQQFLSHKGYVILEINYRCPWGEVDVIARDGDYLVFVEVRTRRSLKYGTPEESITKGKAKRLIATAQTYIETHPNSPSHWRIDLVSV